ncbi:MAG: IclR family transcriptional regulator [Acidimicrobiales bacterium]
MSVKGSRQTRSPATRGSPPARASAPSGRVSPPSGRASPPSGRASPPTDRVVAVLNLLATVSDGEGLTGAEVARTLAISSSTCASLLAGLEDLRYVERGADRTYRLGPGLLPVVHAVHAQLPILGSAEPELRAINRELGFGCSLTRDDLDHLTVIEVVGTPSQTPIALAGERLPGSPPYGAPGIAFRSERDIEAWLSMAPGGPKEIEYLRRFLETIRRRGYAAWTLEPATADIFDRIHEVVEGLAHDPAAGRLRDQLTQLVANFGRRGYLDEELETRDALSVSYIIVPVFDRNGTPRYQIDLHVLQPRVTVSSIEAYARRLTATADALSTALGRS